MKLNTLVFLALLVNAHIVVQAATPTLKLHPQSGADGTGFQLVDDYSDMVVSRESIAFSGDAECPEIGATSMVLNFANGWAIIPPDILKNLEGDLTISFWAKTTSGTTNRPLFTFVSGFDKGPPEPMSWLNSNTNLWDLGGRLIDLNGDGYPDVVRRSQDTAPAPPAIPVVTGSSWLNYGSGWLQMAALTLPQPLSRFNVTSTGARFALLDGDDLPDVIYGYQSGTTTVEANAFRNTGSGWEPFTAGSILAPPIAFGNAITANFDHGRRMWDINGDGRDDLIFGYETPATSTVAASVASGIYLNTKADDGTQSWTLLPDSDHGIPFGSGSERNRGTVVIDLDGDGHLDAITSYQSTVGTVTSVDARVWLWNTTSGSFELQADDSPFMPPVVVGTTGITGPAYVPFAIKGRQSPVLFGDVNGDGFTDLLYYDYTKPIKAWLGSASGWIEDATYAPPVWIGYSTFPDTGRRIVDLDSDGNADLVYSFYNSTSPSPSWYCVTYMNRPVSAGGTSHWVATTPITGINANSYTIGYATSTGTVTFAPIAQTPYGNRGSQFVDLNHDGYPDFVFSYQSGTAITKDVTINTGTGWTDSGGAKEAFSLGYEGGNLVWREKVLASQAVLMVPDKTNPHWKTAWRHWVLVKSASPASVAIYCDGQKLGELTAGTALLAGPAQGTPLAGVTGLLLGRDLLGTNKFTGALDEVTLFNQALNETEVQSLYAAEDIPDVDGDGIADLYEKQMVDVNPADNITSITDVSQNADFDGDGVSNLQEMQEGTSSINAGDVFVDMTWGSQAGVAIVIPVAKQGSSVTRTLDDASGAYGIAGAISAKGAATDAYVRFKIGTVPGPLTAGFALAATPTTLDGNDQIYTIKVQADGSAGIYLGAALQASVASLAAGDMVEFRRTGGLVEVVINGEQAAASPLSSSVTLGFRVAFGAYGVGTNGVRCNGFLLNVQAPAVDTDSDGMDDNWELAHGLIVGTNDANADPDNDGLSNLKEYQFGTDPQNSDTDGDGLNDLLEYQAAQNGNAGVNLDGDGMTDDWEWAYFHTVRRDGFSNYDTDLLLDIDEFNFGFDPTKNDISDAAISPTVVRFFDYTMTGRLKFSDTPGASQHFVPDLEGNLKNAAP